MKLLRNIVILLVVIGLLAGGLYFVLQYEPQEETAELPNVQTVNMFKIEKDSIVSLVVQSAEETYTVEKKDGVWVVNDNPALKISQSRIETLAYEAASITVRELLEDNVTDFAQYGLDAPERSVAIRMTNGTTAKILIGDTTLDGSLCYLMVEGENKVYTKSASGCDSLTSTLERLLDSVVYEMEATDLASVIIEKPGAEKIHLVREAKGTNDVGETTYEWEMKSPLVKTGSSYTIEESLITNIVTQEATAVIPNKAMNPEYGFDKPQAKYTISNADGTETYVVTVGAEVEGKTYLSLEGDTTAYEVSASKLDFLQCGYLDLVDKLIHVENIKDIQKVIVEGGGKTYTMEIIGDALADDAVFKINDEEIAEDRFKKAYQAVIGLMLDDYVAENVSGGTADYTITYLRNDGEKVVVSCVTYDDRNYLVQVNGEGNLLIRKKQIDNMISMLEKVLTEN